MADAWSIAGELEMVRLSRVNNYASKIQPALVVMLFSLPDCPIVIALIIDLFSIGIDIASDGDL
jgi:hypothetical protein